ncbi:MAG: exo-beta-N-acetylmuramidase NamZ domain-containing protein [Vicinamibacterales bacterium]
MRLFLNRLAVLPLLMAICAAMPFAGAGCSARRPSQPRTEPQAPARAAVPASREAAFDTSVLARIDPLVAAAIEARQLPGAVLLIGQGDTVVYQKAFGSRALEPAVEPMTADTIFDLASLTKVVATTTSVMILVEEGRIRLSDRVSAYIPEFGRYGKQAVTLRHLATHTSGLRPDLDLADPWVGYDTAIERAAEEVLAQPPGQRFVYSDINYFLLGEIVRRVSGMPLDRFAEERVFRPLGMKDTMFNPPASLAPRIAPTERCTQYGWPCDGPAAVVLRGVVHDPTARRMAGVAGHAGLFSTANDLSIFCRMLLGGGRVGNVRILSPLAVLKMTMPATPPDQPNVRGIGWDIDSSYSSNRGELLPIGTVQHTGWTGTGLLIDPLTGTYFVFLSNRVHPDGKGDVTPLRARLATIVASAIRPGGGRDLREARWNGGDFGASGTPPPPEIRQPVATGIDVLVAENFKSLAGKKVGLVTNHTGRSRTGDSTIDLLKGAAGVSLVALFSPEHGIRGTEDQKVASGRDEKTGLPVYSLYGETRRPTDEMLAGVDTLVFDVQDVGARFYTYTTTMAYVMEEAARRRIPVVVLDRPNPINGYQIEGPTIPRENLGFTAYFPMPIRHGMTLGELARLFNAENKIGADLTVVAMKNWRRDSWFDDTLFPWTNPSPNMRNLNEAALYPGIGAIEGTNISVGRGTDTPFEQLGAPWIDGTVLARELAARRLPGIRFYPVTFTPSSSRYAGERCGGVFMVVTDREALRPVRVGLEIAAALFRLYPNDYQLDRAQTLLGSQSTLARVKAGDDPAAIAASWAADESRWRLMRAKYLLY